MRHGVQIGNRIVWGIMDRGMSPSAALSQPGLSNLPGFMPVSRQPAVMQLLPPTPTTTTTTTTDYQPVTETTPVSHTTGPKMYIIKYEGENKQISLYATESEALIKMKDIIYNLDLKTMPNLKAITLVEAPLLGAPSGSTGKVIKSESIETIVSVLAIKAYKTPTTTDTTPTTNWTTSTTDTTTTPAPKKADNTWMWIVGGIAAAVGIGGIGYYMVKRKQ